jgi:hypothetical protein
VHTLLAVLMSVMAGILGVFAGCWLSKLLWKADLDRVRALVEMQDAPDAPCTDCRDSRRDCNGCLCSCHRVRATYVTQGFNEASGILREYLGLPGLRQHPWKTPRKESA